MLIIGHFVYQGTFRRIKSYLLILLLILSFCATVLLQFYILNFTDKKLYFVWYNNATLVISSFCIFELICRINFKKSLKIITNLSICSFGIYLIHMPILWLLKSRINFAGFNKVFVLFLATFLISWIVVYIISFTPLKRWLFFMK